MTPPPVLQRLVDAVNRHDLDALTACFAPDFLSEAPAHPDRTFRGRDQVRHNWSEIFRGVPDIRMTLTRCADAGDPHSAKSPLPLGEAARSAGEGCSRPDGAGTVWAEQEFSGTRVDGGPHLMRGVAIFGVLRDQLTSVRFYVEPVQSDGVAIGASVRANLLARP